MRSVFRSVLCLVAVLLIAGCASTKVSDRQQLVKEKLPRPDRIWVYDFAASPEGIPGESQLSKQDGSMPTAEEMETGQKLGAEIAAKLVDEINGMGLKAERATAQTAPRVNDIMIHGYLLTIQEGSAGKRVVVGFRQGKAELKTAVEGFQMTPQGPRKLGSGTLDSGGAKTPGTAVGLGTFLATGNPAGLIVTSGMRVYGEMSGKSKIEGRADQTAKEIAKVLKKRFKELGWI